jgi:peptidoglycan/xylan/chitin deacetylase (PgdA/CDA1 family)
MIRWLIKKAARRAVAALSWASGWLMVTSRAGAPPGVRVLTYHRVRDAARDPFSVTIKEFDRQMAWLRDRRTAISLDDLVDFLDGRASLPNDAVLVTIDDGYDDLRSGALPVLVTYGIPAVAFITAAEMSTGGEADRKLSRDQVAALDSHGIAVGSHAWDHRSLGRMTAEQAAYQATASRTELAKVTGRPLVAFAYPFGTLRDFNGTTGAALRAAGYRCAFTSQHGPVTRASDPMELPRIKIEGGDPFWVFRLAVRGGLDGWRLIDRLGAGLQATERGRASVNPAASSAAARLSGRFLN